MTSKEALEELRSLLESNPGTKQYADIFESNLLTVIERDITLVESLKRVLNKVVRVVYQPEIVSKENENGFIDYYMNHEYKIGEDFDVEFFKEIINQLGFELIKKEN